MHRDLASLFLVYSSIGVYEYPLKSPTLFYQWIQLLASCVNFFKTCCRLFSVSVKVVVKYYFNLISLLVFLDVILFYLLKDHFSFLKFSFPLQASSDQDLNIPCCSSQKYKTKLFRSQCLPSANSLSLSIHLPLQKQTFYNSCVYLFFLPIVHFKTITI